MIIHTFEGKFVNMDNFDYVEVVAVSANFQLTAVHLDSSTTINLTTSLPPAEADYVTRAYIQAVQAGLPYLNLNPLTATT